MKWICALLGAAILTGCNDTPMGFASERDGKIFEGSLLSGQVGVLTDKATKCQYVVVGYTQIAATPRLNTMGQPICGSVSE